jgi:hypothetical protein
MSQITVWDLGYPVDTTGVPARTQHLTGYDAGTLTYTGTKSKVVIARVIPAGKTLLDCFYDFLVTPDVGDPYHIYQSDTRTVTPSTTETITLDYPWIIEADVYLVSARFSFFQSVSDDFESYAAGDCFQLPGSSTWSQSVIFFAYPPNADAWDDFENYAVGATGTSNVLQQLNTGYSWTGAGLFNARDNTDCYDDFEGYSVGSIYLFNQGIGWSDLATATVVFTYYADDDFESYAVGSITTLGGGTSFYWAGDGTIS